MPEAWENPVSAQGTLSPSFHHKNIFCQNLGATEKLESLKLGNSGMKQNDWTPRSRPVVFLDGVRSELDNECDKDFISHAK